MALLLFQNVHVVRTFSPSKDALLHLEHWNVQCCVAIFACDPPATGCEHVIVCIQECILRLFYGNIARLAEYHGDPTASRICAAIASDEGKHAVAYTSIVAQLLWLDPEGCVCVMARLIQQGSMRLPGTSLDDGWHTQANHNRDRPAVTWGAAASLYMDYASVVDAAGVYTLTDHASAVDQLIKTWKVCCAGMGAGRMLQG